jgi:murein DD-endopeptidase MepM/ murein hydrolase activator NlpD
LEVLNKNKKIFLIFSLLGLIIVISLIYVHNVKKESSLSIFISKKEFDEITGVFKSTLERELKNAKLKNDDINQIIKEYSKLKIDFRKLSEFDEYLIRKSTSGDFIFMIIDRGETSYIVKKNGGIYTSTKTLNVINVSTYNVEGEIKNILWTSMKEKNVPEDVILNFADIFAWEIDFLTEVRDGDKFKVIYNVKKNLRGKIIQRKVLAGYYKGKETGKKIMVYFEDDYYNEKGEGARSMFLKAPLQYRRISSYFSYHRFHPILKYVRPHLGIDYAAPTGTPVSAVADGVVTFKGWNAGYGNFVEIKHQMGYVTTYGHLSRFGNIYVGKRVKQGDVVGYVGMTGIATGPHLDFRVKKNGQFINYLKIKRTSNKKLPPSKIPLLHQKIKEYLAIET